MISQLLQRAAALRERLTSPLVRIADLEEEQKVRLLASLILGVTVIMVTVNPIQYLLQWSLPGTSVRFFIIAVTAGILIALYLITRRGYYRLVSWLCVLIGNGMVLLSEMLLPGSSALYYLVIVTFFVSIFFPARITLALSLTQLLVVFTLAAFIPDRMNPVHILEGPGIYLVVVTAILMLFTGHRERLEKIRRSALEESEVRYRIISELISDYAYSLRITPEGKPEIEWMTNSYAAVTGYSLDNIEAGFARSGHPDDVERARADLQAALTGIATSGDYRIITPDGQIKWLNIYRRPVKDETGTRVIRVYGVAKDITQRKNAEMQQLDLAVKQERLNLIGQFVVATSQEFRTSLASIEVNRYLIQRKIAPEEAEKIREQLKQIRHYVTRLTSQIENFHTVSALAGLKTEPRSLNSDISYILSGYTVRAASKQITLQLEPDSSLSPVNINVQEFSSALQALLDNAFVYTPPGGYIRIRTRQEEGFAVVSVEDNGKGIPPEHLPHIFDLFYRVDPARPLDTGGIGLGLSVVQMVAQAHNGKVEVQSAVDKGSIFTLYFPLETHHHHG